MAFTQTRFLRFLKIASSADTAFLLSTAVYDLEARKASDALQMALHNYIILFLVLHSIKSSQEIYKKASNEPAVTHKMIRAL